MEERVDMGTHIMRAAPTARRLADERGWWRHDGEVDWTRVEVALTVMEGVTGAELRLVGTAVLLHWINDWVGQFDAVSAAVVMEAMQAAAEGSAPLRRTN